jgi:hypothetical protein
MLCKSKYNVVISAKIIRNDGTIEDLGVIASTKQRKQNILRRAWRWLMRHL